MTKAETIAVHNNKDLGSTSNEEASVAENRWRIGSYAWKRNGWAWMTILLTIWCLGAGAVGYHTYQSATNELAAMRRTQDEHKQVVELASDYAIKSLTYSFRNPEDFFRSVEDDVSPALKDKYINAHDLLKAVMLQAQVTSTGEVLATDVIEQPGDTYRVTVAASQTVRNLQNPEARVSNIVLQVGVIKAGEKWQISDIGPRTGSNNKNYELTPPTTAADPAPHTSAPTR